MDFNAKDLDLLTQSDLLDPTWYVDSYPDVATLGLPAAEHFLRYGTLLLRDPGPRFNTREYLEANPDVAKARVNALLHYLRFGSKEGRQLRIPSTMASLVKPHVTAPALKGPEPKKRATLRGTFDELTDTVFRGWAIDASKPGKPVELSVYVDGTHLMNFRTSQTRNDVTSNGMNGDIAGFAVTLPAGLFPPGTSIDIRFAATGASLSRSPVQISATAAAAGFPHTQFLDASRSGAILPATVVVPVFNAHDAVSECLASLVANLPSGTDVLMVDDCSTDPRIEPLLASYAARPGFRLHRNETNLGYTRSVNRAISLSTGRDIVLLNSDTVVTPRWLHNLRYCAYATPHVATVTALSDNAGAFSVPEIGVANEIPPNLNTTQFARAVTHAGAGRLLEVPTGNGFCLYIRRAALDTVGAFDEEKFPRGYGEENDLCMRALRRGWKNIVCDKALVFHKRSQSFQGEKASLMEAGNKQVSLSYPEYRLLTQRFSDVEFSMVRRRVRAAIGNASSALPRILFVISTQTGGTPQTNMDLMLAMRGHFECLLLRCDASVVTLSRLVDNELRQIEAHKLPSTIDPVSHRSEHYDRIVLNMLYRHSIELLHIRHVAWHGLGLAESAKALGIPVVYSMHDFYSLCPSLNLLDDQLRHCGAVCTSGEGNCQPSLWPRGSMPVLKHRFIGRWQEMFGQFIDKCDQLITTAASAAATISRIYPQAEGKLAVIPHGRDFAEMHELASRPQPREKIRVLVPGNISVSKGALLIKEITKLDTEGRFEFHLLGDTSIELAKIGVHHGRYDRAKFHDKVATIAPHLGVVLSIWPETYCHTLTEMWSSGIPVFAIDLGAVGDRIRASGAGWLVAPSATAVEVLNNLRDAVDDAAGYEQRAEATRCWQSTEGVWNNTATMAAEYRSVYRRLLDAGSSIRSKRVGLVIKGTDAHPATAHIRLLTPLSAPSLRQSFDARPVSVPWLLAGGIDHVDLVVAQRDAVPAHLVEQLLNAVAKRGVPLVFEVDDLLWELPPHHTDHSISKQDLEAMLKLAARADLATVSTPALAAKLHGIAKQVEVIPNALDAALWTGPVPDSLLKSVRQSLGLGDGEKALLYMGTKSHAADLELVRPAIEEVAKMLPNLRVFQIGGGKSLPHAKMLSPPKGQTGYREFVPWFRAVCAHMTAAIAPLRDDEFNFCKSDIKALDYGLGLVPAVFSEVGPYKRAIVHEATGLLTSNTTDAWRKSVIRLLKDDALRTRIRDAAYGRALARTTESVHLAWKAALDRAGKSE